MSLDRYNTQRKRLEKLQELSRQKDTSMTSKQHREMQVLRSSFTMNDEEYSSQSMLKIVKYIEGLKSLDRATSSDLARLTVLKNKLHIINLELN